MKKYNAIDILWIISILIIAIVTIILSIMSIVGCEMPKALRITLGVLDLIALPILGFTTVRKFIENKQSRK